MSSVIEPRIPVKNAVAQAMQYLVDLLAERKPSGLRLEEVELSEDGAQWLITLSFLEIQSVEEQSPIAKAMLQTPLMTRVYKQIRLDSETGKFISMRIREFSHD